jgi:glycosyltransferase involved in cell wall biosynthesis
MPKVSFVVPCYKLAHLLPECVTSILAQTYEDFEILIMDDSSPDSTPEVARSFSDSRVMHVRNKTNLGHLRNYNKGIELSRGTYVWLISADDRLRCRYVLEKYVALMEAHPEVGYVICPGVGLCDNEETSLLEYSHHGDKDTIFDGREFVRKLLEYNSVIAAAGMVRKQLYEQFSTFPLDLPYAGDWYLWCLFALHSEVGYFAEPMVNYRQHQLSITNTLMDDGARVCIADNIAVAWHIKRAVEATEHRWLTKQCDDSIVRQCASSLAGNQFVNASGMTPFEFEQSVRKFATSPEEVKQIRVRSYLQGGDQAFWMGKRQRAAALYGLALRSAPLCPRLLFKYMLLHLGDVGDCVREGIGAVCHSMRPGTHTASKDGGIR